MSKTELPGIESPATCYASAIGIMRERAKELGYALALHGSMQRDLDIIAVPWVDDAATPQALVQAICEVVGGFVIPDGTKGGRWDAEKKAFVDAVVRNPELKPHGRLAWNIHLGGRPFIDLSVMPRIE